MTFQSSTCTYQANGTFVCKKKKDDDENTPRQQHIEHFLPLSSWTLINSNVLISKGGINILNPGEWMMSSHRKCFLYFNPDSYSLECRLWPFWQYAFWMIRPWAKGGYPKYAKLHTNGKFSLYASKHPNGTNEFEYWSTEKTGSENAVYRLDISGFYPRIIDNNDALLKMVG